MQFFMVNVPGFLFMFLISMTDLEEVKTQTSVSRVVERNSVTEQGEKVCETWVRSSLEDFKGEQIFNTTQQCLETKYIIDDNGKCTPKLQRALMFYNKAYYAFKKSCEVTIVMRRKAKQRQSTVRTPPPTVRTWPTTVRTPSPTARTWPRTVRTPPATARPLKVVPIKTPAIKEKELVPSKRSASCEGKILYEKSDSAGMCQLLNRTTGVAIFDNVPCQDHTGCFMTNNRFCKSFRKGNWKDRSFKWCDTDYRVTRAVEKGISTRGKKTCKIMYKPSLAHFDGLQIFNKISQCLKTYYIRNNNDCTPKLKKNISNDDVFYYLKKDCEDAIKNNG